MIFTIQMELTRNELRVLRALKRQGDGKPAGIKTRGIITDLVKLGLVQYKFFWGGSSFSEARCVLTECGRQVLETK